MDYIKIGDCEYNAGMKSNYINITDDYDSDDLYRKELLMLFNYTNDELENIDIFKLMSSKVESLYKHLENTEYINEINNMCKLSCARLMSDDNIMGLIMLFTYDTFYLVHQLFSELFTKNTFNRSIYNNIVSKL